MVFAISAPALAENLNPPDWAGAPGTIYGIWEFPSAGSGQVGDYPEEGAMVPHDTNPDPDELDETIDTEGAHQHMMVVWTYEVSWLASHEGREGVVSGGMSLGAYNFPGDGTKLIRLQLTYTGSETSFFFFGASGGTYTGPVEWDMEASDALIETVDLGGGWSHSTYEFLIEANPDWEEFYVGYAPDTMYFDQIVIHTICYEGDEPPGKPPLTVDSSSDMPVYEPQDAGGPPPSGPTAGQLHVSLAWQPGDPTYPTFTATVVIDPNEVGPHEDFKFSDSTNPNGTITLTFTEADWSDPQPVNVEALEDLDREGNESYPIELTVTIDIADPNFGNPTPVVVESSVGVVDNDVPFVVAYPPGALEDVLTENDPCMPKCVNIILSHLPCDPCDPCDCSDVYVLVTRYSDGDEYDVLLESMSVMDPPLGATDDPNKLKFTPGNYDTPQPICLEARDDPCRPDTEAEWIQGTVIFTPYSENVQYRVLELDAQGNEVEDSGGEAEESVIYFNVQDNECGAWGYAGMDFNEDCRVGLADFAHLLAQWLICTDPYDSSTYGQWDECDALWNLVETEEE